MMGLLETTRCETIAWKRKTAPAGNRGLATTTIKESKMDACEHTCSVCAALANPDLPRRFWSKVDVRGYDECWPWTGHTNKKGYGRFNIGSSPDYAHRVSYRLTHGEIPAGLEVDHLCWNPSCVNPRHLRAVTRQVNLASRRTPGATGLPGLAWNSKRERWQVKVTHDGRDHWGGRFVDRAEAEAALQTLRSSLKRDVTA